jgi:ribosomal protein S15P/S13E
MTEAQRVIESKIKRAHDLLRNFGPAFDRPKEISNGILCLTNVCEALIGIVEHQQEQIAFLNDRCDSLRAHIKEVQHG